MKLSSFLINLLFVRVITHELCRSRKIQAEVLTQGCGKKQLVVLGVKAIVYLLQSHDLE